jgi:transglutaminase-like putative cysteine protease
MNFSSISTLTDRGGGFEPPSNATAARSRRHDEMLFRRRKNRANNEAKTAKPAVKASLSVERLLQITVAVMVPMGVMMLGLDRDLTLAAIVLVASVSSVFLTDLWGWIRLNRLVANGMALVATAACFAQFAHATIEEQLLDIANLLVYLQIILLFQQKSVRHYWQLLVLSGLQVVVATALNTTIFFGLLLVVYLFVALTALGLIFILSEARRNARRTAAAHQFVVQASRLHDAAETAAPQSVGSVAKARWPLRREIEIVASPQRELAQQILGRGILWRTAGIGAGTLIVATVCFFFLPRFGKALVNATGGQSIIGYTESVKLGDLGERLQSPELVMRVEFRNAAGNPLAPIVPPLFRGSLLNHYRRGEWQLISGEIRGSSRAVDEPPSGVDLARQLITIQPIGQSVLFGVYPVYSRGQSNKYMQYSTTRQQLVRYGPARAREYSYELLTSGIPRGRQMRLVPKQNLRDHEMPHLLQLPDDSPFGGPLGRAAVNKRDSLAGLRQFAARQISDAHVAPGDHYAVAKLLERVLSAPPFEYTLNRPPSQQDGTDPIEDFVTRNPRGHCEYFASALALMLRSQHIPARVVMGFHGGDWNAEEFYYDVRQLHSHAWVEAYLSPEQVANVPPQERPTGVSFDDGAWLVLDATPTAGIGDVAAEGLLMASLIDMKNYVKMIWNTYVIGLDADRQSEAIYKPLADLYEALKKLCTEPKQTLSDMFNRLGNWLFGGGSQEEDAGVDWYVVIALFILLTTMYVIYRLTRIAARIGQRALNRRRTMRAARGQVDFYRRFERLLARHGIRRAKGQTPLELARAAATRLASANGSSQAAIPLPARLVATFYRVRYGHAALDSTEAHAIDLALAEIGKGLGARGSGLGS